MRAMMGSMSLAISRWLFDQIHSRNLIYNQCWEDPELDHAVLDIGSADRIVMAARPDARIIYRSGGVNCDYIPEFASRHLRVRPDLTNELHARDRVGTYGSFYFAKVQP
jgi:S-adenosylmethionine:diacylglycerol 3-amino-3-carboxypropyl transferase